MTDTFRALCAELLDEISHESLTTCLARAALAEPEPEVPTDEELLELMPEAMRDEFSYAAKVCSDVTGGQVKPGIFRVCLNTAALEHARAVLARWGNHRGILGSSPQPVPVSERLPGPEDCDAEGRCWWWYPPVPEQNYGYWIYEDNAVPERARLEWPDCWLPAYALPLPSGEVE